MQICSLYGKVLLLKWLNPLQICRPLTSFFFFRQDHAPAPAYMRKHEPSWTQVSSIYLTRLLCNSLQVNPDVYKICHTMQQSVYQTTHRLRLGVWYAACAGMQLAKIVIKLHNSTWSTLLREHAFQPDVAILTAVLRFNPFQVWVSITFLTLAVSKHDEADEGTCGTSGVHSIIILFAQ